MKIDTKSLIKKLDSKSLKALENAINLAVTQHVGEVSVAHWLFKLAEQSGSFFFVLLEWFGRKERYAIEKFGLKFNIIIRWLFYSILIISLFIFGGDQQEFIYFQF